MKIGIISGSQRLNSQTKKVCNYMHSVLTELGHESEVLDLGASMLPHKTSSQMEHEDLKANLDQYHTLIQSCDGLIIASPEWGGAATPAIMSALLHADNLAAHKPALITTVSASRGGSYLVSQIRSFGFKNNHVLFIPEHIIVHDVREVLNGPESINKADSYIRERIQWALQILTQYAKHTKSLREESQDLLANEKFQNGMS